jgi:hypothetical protein
MLVKFDLRAKVLTETGGFWPVMKKNLICTICLADMILWKDYRSLIHR